MDIVEKFVNLSIKAGSTVSSLSKSPEELNCVLAVFQSYAANPEKPTLREAKQFLDSAGSWLSVTPEELVKASELLRPVIKANLSLCAVSKKIEDRRELNRQQRRQKALQREKEVAESRIDRSRDDEFMQEALDCAKRAGDAMEVPVGAVVVDEKGRIIGRGYNRVIANSDPTAHAEIIAIRQAAQYKNNYRLENCTLYVTLEPCPMCAGAIIHSRLARLVYGATDEKGGGVESVEKLLDQPKLNHHTWVTKHVRESECKALLQSFFAEKRKSK